MDGGEFVWADSLRDWDGDVVWEKRADGVIPIVLVIELVKRIIRPVVGTWLEGHSSWLEELWVLAQLDAIHGGHSNGSNKEFHYKFYIL